MLGHFSVNFSFCIVLEVKDLECETRDVGGSSGVGTGKIVKCQRVVVEC